jgi:hypothetical protein
MQVRQRRQAQFPFATSTDVRQILALDGNVAFNFNVAAGGNATRASQAVAKERRIELLGNPISAVRAALDPEAKLGRLHKEGAMQLGDVIPPTGDHLTLEIEEGTHLPSSVRCSAPAIILATFTMKPCFLTMKLSAASSCPNAT